MKRGSMESFWARVRKTDTCWLWQGTGTPKGYGQFTPAGGKRLYVHRLSFELANGPIADGLTVDHLCRNRACVRPDHMEVVSRGTNALRGTGPAATNARKTHCIHGHEFTPENTYQFENHRQCRACARLRRRSRRSEGRAA